MPLGGYLEPWTMAAIYQANVFGPAAAAGVSRFPEPVFEESDSHEPYER